MTNLQYILSKSTDNDIALLFSQIAGYNFFNFYEGFADELYFVLHNYLHECGVNKMNDKVNNPVRHINRFLSLQYNEKEWKRLADL